MITRPQTQILQDQGLDLFQAVQTPPLPPHQGRRLRVGLADRVQALLLFLVVATANINPPRVWLGQEQPVQYLLRNVQIVQYASEICLLVLVVSFIFPFYEFCKSIAKILFDSVSLS